MGRPRAFWLRLRGIFSRRKAVEFEAELESHIAMDTDEAVRTGIDSDEARRQALLRLGGAEQARQAYRDRATCRRLKVFFRMCTLHCGRCEGLRDSRSLP